MSEEMKVGAKVAYQSGGWTNTDWEITTIVRETKTQWITEDGKRWRKSNLEQIKKHDMWTKSTRLFALTPERQQEIDEQRAGGEKKRLWHEITELKTPHHLTVEKLEEILKEAKGK